MRASGAGGSGMPGWAQPKSEPLMSIGGRPSASASSRAELTGYRACARGLGDRGGLGLGVVLYYNRSIGRLARAFYGVRDAVARS